ncbi:MAG TPA: DUF5683 domain-containing protein [bacterium]
MRQLIVILFLLSAPVRVFCQTSEQILVEEIQNAYNQLNYPEAEIKARAALKDFQRFSPVQLTEIHKILGLIYFSQNREEAARLQFENVLALTPHLKLDPLFVSPKIMKFFEDIQRERAMKSQDQSAPQHDVKYVLVHDPRPEAGMRSILLPGWGQLYKGEKTKGRILLGLWSAGVVATVASHVARARAEDKYLSETDPDRIESRYGNFNTIHKLRNNLIVFSAGVWLYSYIDAIVKKSPVRSELSSPKTLLILPDWSTAHPRLSMVILL